MHTIQLSEEVYRRLHEQAVRLKLSPEQVLDRLLSSPTLSVVVLEAEFPLPAPNSDEAFAAVERLTHLFADVTLPNLDAVLTDPAIALANAELDDLLR